MQFDDFHESKHEDPKWFAEAENCSTRELNESKCNDILMLQNHIDELNNERRRKDSLLQSMHTTAEDLRIELADKDRELQEKTVHILF